MGGSRADVRERLLRGREYAFAVAADATDSSRPTSVTDHNQLPVERTFAAYSTIAAVVVYEMDDSDFGVSAW
jgi:hypothetical protein